MNRMKIISTLALSAGLTAGFGVVGASESLSVTIERLDGLAMVSSGASYVEASEGMQLSAADRVLVLDDSSATLRSKSGCERTLQESELLTVSAESLCAPDSATRAAATGDFAAIERGATSQLVPNNSSTDDDDLAIFGVVAAGGMIWALAQGTGAPRTDPPLDTPSP